MSNKCQICGKGKIRGSTISRRGVPKKAGGIGRKTTSITKRVFFPNLQKKRVFINGKIRQILVCTKCIKKFLKSPLSKNNLKIA